MGHISKKNFVIFIIIWWGFHSTRSAHTQEYFFWNDISGVEAEEIEVATNEREREREIGDSTIQKSTQNLTINDWGMVCYHHITPEFLEKVTFDALLTNGRNEIKRSIVTNWLEFVFLQLWLHRPQWKIIVFHAYVLILSILSSEITFTFFFIWIFKRIGTELRNNKFFKIIQIAIREGEIQDLPICVSAWRIVLIFIFFLNPFEFDRRSFERATSQKVQNVIYMYIKYVVGRCRMCLCFDEKRERIRPFICV